MDTAFIKIRNIAKKYGRHEVLKDVSLDVEQGDCIGIVGANGCGKSTLLGILSGSLRPAAGTLTYNGKNPLRERAVFSEMIGYVPQENPLMTQLSVLDNLKFWYFESGRNLKQDLINGTPAALGLAAYASVRVDRLSGGLKKRLSIACALAKDPPVLILDEPGASLDIVCKQDIQNELSAYLKSGKTIIITSHEEPELALCTRMMLLREGTLCELDGCPKGAALMQYLR